MIETYDQLQKIVIRCLFPQAKFRRKTTGEMTFEVVLADAKNGWVQARTNTLFVFPKAKFQHFKGGSKSEVFTGLIMDHRGDVVKELENGRTGEW